jgi:DNA-binding MarR family transcriptional regulator
VQRSLPGAESEALVLRLSALTTRRDGCSRTAAATLTRLAGSEPTRPTEPATAEGVTQPSMSALVARLVARGLVHRGSDPQDTADRRRRPCPDPTRRRAAPVLDPAEVTR